MHKLISSCTKSITEHVYFEPFKNGPSSSERLHMLFQELMEFIRLFGVSGWWKSATDVVPFQIMIIDYKLTYPSGTATAVLINGFHTTHGDATAKYVVLSHNSSCRFRQNFNLLNCFCVCSQ